MSDKEQGKSQPKEQPKILPNDCKLAEFERQVFRGYPDPGVTKEQVLAPEYWAHMSRKFKPGDKIELFAQDGLFYAELLVLQSDRNWAKVHELVWYSLSSKDVAMSQASKYQHRFAPGKKHCIVRTTDGEIVHEGSQTKEAALQWLAENAGVLA